MQQVYPQQQIGNKLQIKEVKNKLNPINVQYPYFESIEKVKVAVSREIIEYHLSSEDKFVLAVLNYYTDNGEIIDKKSYQVTGTYYDLLMSDSPSFAPGKPSNDFRRDDLGYIIDKIDADQQTIS